MSEAAQRQLSDASARPGAWALAVVLACLCLACLMTAPRLAWADEGRQAVDLSAQAEDVALSRDAGEPDAEGQGLRDEGNDAQMAGDPVPEEAEVDPAPVESETRGEQGEQVPCPLSEAEADELREQASCAVPTEAVESAQAEPAVADDMADEAAFDVPAELTSDAPAEAVAGAPSDDADGMKAKEGDDLETEELSASQVEAMAAAAAAAMQLQPASEGGSGKGVQQAASLPKAKSIAKSTRAKVSDAGQRLHIAQVAKRTTKRTLADGIYLVSASANAAKMLQSAGGSTKAGADATISADLNAIHQRWSLAYIKDGLYSVKNIKSGNYLAVRGGKAAFYTPVVQDAKASAASERWRLVKFPGGYRLVSALSPWLALSVAADGSSTRVVSVRNASAQRWSAQGVTRTIADGVYAVSNAKSGRALTVKGGAISSGSNVIQSAADGSLAQVFAATYNPNTGYYRLTAPSGNSLDVQQASAASGANVWIATTNGTNAQDWSIVKAGNSYRLVSAISGKVLEIAGGSTSDGANARVATSNDSASQRFTFKKLTNWIPEGAYRIVTSINRSNGLAVAGSGADGANVGTAASSGANSQRFYLRPAGSGGYTIQTPLAGTYLSVAYKASGANVRQAKASQVWLPTITAAGITFTLKESKQVALNAAGSNVNAAATNGARTQQFILVPTGLLADGVYTIGSDVDTKFVFDTYGQSRDNGVRLQVCKANNTIAQQYRLTRLSSGAYRIANIGSGKALQAMAPSAASGQVQQQTPGSAVSQQWNLAMNADGSLSILSAASKNATAMVLASSKPDNYVKVNTAKRANVAAQHWRVAPSSVAIQAYDALSITLDQMAAWQLSSPFNASYSQAQMRDFLDPSKLDAYQFIDLREGAGATAAQLNKVISSQGIAGGKFAGLGQAFIDGAAKYGINEVFLLSLAALESGWGTSELASGYAYGGGTIDGGSYAAGTYYNFFGIGAFDNSPLSGGRKAAIVNGWSTPAKAIEGAAKWIAENYVYRSEYAQPTLYAMRWDYAYSNVNKQRGWHQYSTGVNWSGLVSGVMSRAYREVTSSVPKVYLTPRYR